MPQVRFEPTIPVYEREKTVHALDRAATVIGGFMRCKSDKGASPPQCTRDTVPPVCTTTDFISYKQQVSTGLAWSVAGSLPHKQVFLCDSNTFIFTIYIFHIYWDV
jgi:hypothetical protein